MNIQSNRVLLLLIGVLLYGSWSCAEVYDVTSPPLSKEDVIEYYIDIFSATPGSFRKYSIFEVSYYDTVYRYELIRNDTSSDPLSGGYQWRRVGHYDGIRAVCFSVVSKEVRFFDVETGPNRRKEIRGRSFLWRDGDDDNPEVIMFLRNKGLLSKSESLGDFKYPIKDDEKYVTFFFQNENPCKFKRITDTRAIGYYPPPSFSSKHAKERRSLP